MITHSRVPSVHPQGSLGDERSAEERSETGSDSPWGLDAHPWRVAILLTAALVGGALLWSIAVNPAFKHVRYWAIAGDAWPPLDAARYVSAGAYPYLYQANSVWVAGPLLPVLLAPVAALQDSLALTSRSISGYAFRLGTEGIAVANVPFPTVWPLYGAYAVALSGLLLIAVRRVARAILSVTSGESRNLLPAATQALVAVLGVSIAAGYWMHLEDVLGIAALLFAVTMAMQRRWAATAVWIGLAVGFKQWTVLPAVLLLSWVPRSERRRFLAVALGVPAVLYGTPLLMAPAATVKALFRAGSFPWLGHAAPWITDPTARVVVGATPGRIVWTLAAVGVAWLVRRRRDIETLCAASAMVFAARIVTESVTYSYYLLGVIVFMALLEVARRRSVLRTAISGAAAMAWYWVPPPRTWWWFVEVALLVVLVWPAVRVVASRDRSGETQSDPVVNGATREAIEAPDPTPVESVIPSTTA